MASCHEALTRYFTLEDPTRLEPAERELYVETLLESKLLLRGFVDRVDVAPTGEIRVVDYKTGKAPHPAFEAKALFQMKFYALVIWRTRGVVPAMLQLIYLGSGELLRYSPDEADLRATERKVEALWKAISLAQQTGDWRPRRSALCGWCSHQALCPEFGGTPLEVLDPSGSWFRVRVTDTKTGRNKVNVNIPMGLVNVGIKMGARFAPDVEGFNFDQLIQAVRSGQQGKVVDVFNTEEGERIEIFVE